MANIISILNGTATTEATTSTDLAATVEKLAEQVRVMALQATDPQAYAKLIKEAETKEKKERAASMFNSMSIEEQKKEYASFKKSITKVTLKDVNDEIDAQITAVEQMGVTDKKMQKELASKLLGFDITDPDEIKAERDRRNQEAIQKAAEAEVESLAEDYKMLQAFSSMFK